jgi:hypothetical protein
MPTTRPPRSTSGPPELPGRISASCWIQRVKRPVRRPSASSGSASSLPVASVNTRRGLPTMPRVTDDARASGLPIASTGWPTSSAEESPRVAAGKRRPASRRHQLEHRQVGRRVVGDDLGLELLAGGQRRRDARRVAGDVVVGQHVPVGADDHPAAAAQPAHRAAAVEAAVDHRQVDQRRIDGVAGDGHRLRRHGFRRRGLGRRRLGRHRLGRHRLRRHRLRRHHLRRHRRLCRRRRRQGEGDEGAEDERRRRCGPRPAAAPGRPVAATAHRSPISSSPRSPRAEPSPRRFLPPRGTAASTRPASRLNGSDCSHTRPGPVSLA